MVLISHCPDKMQELLTLVGDAASRLGLSFKPAKCASLHLDGSKHTAIPTSFTIHGGTPRVMDKDDFYKHLGVPTGFQQHVDIDSSAAEIKSLIEKVDASLLAPWQKFEASRIFILPRLSFIMKSGFVPKGPLNTIDEQMTAAAKKWTSLPPRASTEVFNLPYHKGGLGLFPLATLNDVSTVAQADKFLQSRDPVISSIASSSLNSVVSKRMKTKTISPADTAAFLDGSTEGALSNSSDDHTTLWARARAASSRLKKTVKMSWTPGNKNTTLTVGGAIPAVSAENALKRAFQDKFLDRLIQKRSQGKAYASTCQSPTANHFLREGSFTRFTDWRFIHKARLNVLSTNYAKYHKPGTLKCRRCADWNETLPHVLNHCTPNLGLITERHDRVLHRLYNALPDSVKAQTRLDCTVIHSISMGRPDLVVVDEEKKHVIIVDVTIPFDDGPRAMEVARSKKLIKYSAIANELTAKGYTVVNEAFVVGTLGSFPSRNFLVARALGINSNYAKMMARLMVSDTIRWSRDIYYTHITGREQEKPRSLGDGIITQQLPSSEEEQEEAMTSQEEQAAFDQEELETMEVVEEEVYEDPEFDF